MSKVVLDVSMSLDGFTAGPNVREAEPMGDGGERLHAWMAGNGPDGQIDIGVRQEADVTVGATVIGRRTFDLGVRPWGGTPWPGIPSFVVTHRARQDLLGNNGGMFAFDGLEAAVRRAKQTAGHKDVLVLGADVGRQLLRAGLLDEVRIHLVPLLLGGGTPLFDGEQAELIPEGKPVTGTVIHLRFRVATAYWWFVGTVKVQVTASSVRGRGGAIAQVKRRRCSPDPGAVGADVGSTLAAAWRTAARSTPSSPAHQSSGRDRRVRSGSSRSHVRMPRVQATYVRDQYQAKPAHAVVVGRIDSEG